MSLGVVAISTHRQLFKQKLGFMTYFVCLLAASFYFYEFILQVSPSVITNELMRELAIDATQLGFVSAFFYYTYTPMQIPAGLLYDRYGPQLLLTVACMICVVGAFLFAMAESAWTAGIGRAFIGVGGAFSFIGALVLISRWFPPVYFALMAGMVQFLGSVGSMFGTKPLAESVAVFGWRPSLMALGFAGIALAVLIWRFVSDYPPNKKPNAIAASPVSGRRQLSEWNRLQRVLSRPQTWVIGLFSLSIWAPILFFAALWGTPFLKVKFGISDVEASGMIMMIWLGIALASPAVGYLSNRMGSRTKPLYWGALLGVIASTIVIYIPQAPIYLIYVCLFFYGIAAAGQSLAFAVINDYTERELVGTAIGVNNMATVAGGALFQPLVGRILDWRWDGTVINGVPFYDVSMYHTGLLLAPLCFLLCFIMAYWFINETYCEPQYLSNLPAQAKGFDDKLLCASAD